MVLKKMSKKKATPKIEEEIEEIEEAVEEDEIEEEVEESPKVWSVRQVPIQTESAIYNEITGEHLTVHEAMVRMLNQFEVA